jgi:anti-anti-sigma factor
MSQTHDTHQSTPAWARHSTGSLTIVVQGSEDSYLLRAEGELDISNVELFEESLRAAEAAGAPQIVVDLNALTFMDSTGLRVLLMASRRVRRQSRRLSVRATGGVRRIIELTGMASYLALPKAT